MKDGGQGTRDLGKNKRQLFRLKEMTPTWKDLSIIIGLCNRAYFKEDQGGVNILDKLAIAVQ